MLHQAQALHTHDKAALGSQPGGSYPSSPTQAIHVAYHPSLLSPIPRSAVKTFLNRSAASSPALCLFLLLFTAFPPLRLCCLFAPLPSFQPVTSSPARTLWFRRSSDLKISTFTTASCRHPLSASTSNSFVPSTIYLGSHMLISHSCRPAGHLDASTSLRLLAVCCFRVSLRPQPNGPQNRFVRPAKTHHLA